MTYYFTTMAGDVMLLRWISNNPGPFASLISAIIAASVAIIVFAITQYLMRKRERAQLLTPKLEELYALINEVAAWNVTVSSLAYQCADGDESAYQKLLEMDDLTLYGHRHAKSIIMYIRLYFPELSQIHQMLFAAQRELNTLMWKLNSENPPKLDDLVEAGGEVGHFLRLMENEIIRNRDALVKDKLWPPRFMSSTDVEIKDRVPRPNVPLFNTQKRTQEKPVIPD